MIRPVVRAMVVVGTFVVAASGCSGGGSATPSTTVEVTVAPTTSEVTTTTPSTSAPETSTSTVPPATTEPTVPTTEPTVPSTSDPTSTTTPDGVPPRVTFPDDPDLQAVVDALYVYLDAARAAQADPTDEQLAAGVLDVSAEPLRSRLVDFLAELAASGEAIVPNPDQPTYTEVYEASALVLGDSASLDVCAVDADMRVRPDANPDGTDDIVDDTIVSVALTYTFVRQDARWLVSDLESFGRWDGKIGCD